MPKRATRIAIPSTITALAPKYWGASWEMVAYGRGEAPPLFATVGDAAVVCIDGPLEQHATWFGDAYDDIRARVTAALASESTRVVLRICSPGGEFAGCIELSRELRAAAAKAGKKLVAWTDSRALSAAFALACAASEIVITPSAFVGSVGVWAPLVDTTAQDKMMGLNIRVVASGARKTDSNPHVPITDDAETALRTQVDAMAEMFFAYVAETRGMSIADVAAIEGAEVFGARAVRLGLADRIEQSFEAYVGSVGTSKGETVMSKRANALAALRAMAESDDKEEKEEGKKALALFEKDEKKDDADAKAKAESDDKEKEEKEKEEKEKEAKKAKAADEKEKEKEKEGEGKKALALAESIQARLAKSDTDAEISALLATRPDFDAAVVELLRGLTVAQVKSAVEKYPKATRRFAPAAASQVVPDVVGARQGDGSLGGPEEDFVAQAMGGAPKMKFGVGVFDLSAAAAHVKSISGGSK